jgi:hypothetical protein
VTKQFRDLGDVLWIGAVQALSGIAWRSGDIDAASPMVAEASVGAADTNRVVATAGSSRWLEVGAGASLQDVWAALARHWPELAKNTSNPSTHGMSVTELRRFRPWKRWILPWSIRAAQVILSVSNIFSSLCIRSACVGF